MSDFFDQSKITQLYRSLFLDEHILWFNVSMEEAMAVDVVEGWCDLLYDMPDLLVRKWVIVQFAHLHHSVEVHIEQFKHHVESVLVANHLNASDYIWMLKANHGFDFGVSHCRLPRCELAFEGLQSVDLFGFFVSHLVNHAKTAFTEGF